MTPDEKIRRGQRAAEILADELVDEALSTMRAFVVNGFCKSALGQRDEREALYFLNVGIIEFEKHFRSIIETGQMAESTHARDEAERKAEAP